MNPEIEKVLYAANFMYKSQGYADIDLIERMSGVPGMVVANILKQNNYIVSPGNEKQYLKEDNDMGV